MWRSRGTSRDPRNEVRNEAERGRMATDRRLAVSTELTMSCETVERIISESRIAECGRSDTADSAAFGPSVLAHVQRCAACRRELEGSHLTRPLWRLRARDAQPDPLFVPSVLSRLRDEIAPIRRRERAVRGRWLAATAAALLVGLFGVFQLSEAKFPGSSPDGRPLASSETLFGDGRADEFLLGQFGAYLQCEWIPSGETIADSGEVRF